MTIERWLAHRSPPPPDALASRIGELLGAHASDDESSAAERLAAAAERVLARLLGEECASRQSALDLLAADAMATYAFEAAAEEPERIVERTERAMSRMAALAGTPVDSGGPDDASDGAR